MRPKTLVDWNAFSILVEVVPPAHSNPEPVLSDLKEIARLPLTGFNIATNPVAKPRLSALAMAALIQEQTGKPAVLHLTPRDHNRLALQSQIWGAKALGIDTVLVTSGDRPATGPNADTSFVGDLTVFELIHLSTEAGLQVGVAFDPPRGKKQLSKAVERLAEKKAAGADFAITQPAYQEETARFWSSKLKKVGIPILVGILPLISKKHALFMDQHVAGIHIPAAVLEAINQSNQPANVGIENARSIIQISRDLFQGVCLMPPFQQYQLVADLISSPG